MTVNEEQSVQSKSLTLCQELIDSWKKHLYEEEIDHIHTLIEAFRRLNLAKEDISVEEFLQTCKSQNVPVDMTSTIVDDVLSLDMKSNFPINCENLLFVQEILQRIVHLIMSYFSTGYETSLLSIKDGLLNVVMSMTSRTINFLLGGLILTVSIFLLTRLWNSAFQSELIQKWFLIESENIQWIKEKLEKSSGEEKDNLNIRLRAALERSSHYQAEMMATNNSTKKLTFAVAGSAVGILGGGGLAFAFSSVGAVVGSVVPIIGTAVGAGVGATIGAVAGWMSAK